MIEAVARLGYPAAAAGDATAPRNGAGFVRGAQRRDSPVKYAHASRVEVTTWSRLARVVLAPSSELATLLGRSQSPTVCLSISPRR
jgi:hypothetical protein